MQLEPRNISFSTPTAVRRLDDIRLDHQIVVEEVGRIAVIRQDAADLGRRQEHTHPAWSQKSRPDRA
jgi:hypothetical protein